MNIAGSLKEADTALFYLVNEKWSSPGLDNFMLLLRQPYTWIPLYLFFLLFFYFNCRKYFSLIVLLSVITFAITDFTSASVIKPFIGRLRPCHDSTLIGVNSLAGCGGIFGMPSSHASNHFGLAMFWFLIIRETVNQKWFWLFLWAFAICYSQVYVGVHFPGDILVGILLGVATASVTFYFFKRITNYIDHSETAATKMQGNEV